LHIYIILHDRKRTEEPTEAEKRKTAEKIGKYNRLKCAILDKQLNKVYDAVGDQVSASLIGVNPDFYSLFNYRRNLLESYFAQGRNKAELCDAELQVTQAGLTKNSKSYGVWHHRKWVISQDTSDLQNELAMCSKLLDLDSRNFHCWKHRQVIVRKIGTRACLETEFEYTTKKINQDFSNYSAWHYRSVLLPQLVDEKDQNAIDLVVRREFSLVQQAFYTEPDDQSAWLFYRWLLGGISQGDCCSTCVPQSGAGFRVTTPDVFKRELSVCEELLNVEPSCKWVLLTVALLLTALHQGERLAGIFSRLQEIDPMRVQYYVDMQNRLTQCLVTPSSYCLVTSCWEPATSCCFRCRASFCAAHARDATS